MPKRLVPSQVFVLRGKTGEEWYAIVEGKTFGPWRSKGEAKAGLQVEQRRANSWREKTNAST